MDSASRGRPEQSGRRLVLALAASLLALVAYFSFGMPGMDHSTTSTAGMEMASLVAVGPAAFAARADDEGVFVVNVHTRDEGQIPGTDERIPFDRIVTDSRLPVSKRTPILLYCLTGRMSRLAGEALLMAGYQQVSHLAGGMKAWEGEGLTPEARGGG